MDDNNIIPTTMAIITNRSSDTDIFVFEDYNQRIAIAIILCIIFIVGTIGNTLVITAVVLSRKLRSTTNWFIVNLGCSNLLTCLCLPFNVVALLSRDGWPLPGWICSANSIVTWICLGSSITTLAHIAHNRWYLLTKSGIQIQKRYTTRNICFLLLIAWMYPALWVLLPYFTGLGRLGYSYKYKACSQLPTTFLHSLTPGAFAVIHVLIITVVIYVRIYLFVSRQSMMIQARPHVTVTKRLAVVVLAFIICLLPFGVSVLIYSSDPGIPWTGLMVTFNSCVNPLIYARTMPEFRKVMLAIIRCRLKDITEPIVSGVVVQGIAVLGLTVLEGGYPRE